ncbi:hypothetical protein N6Y36_09480 [Morganella morganii]|nr:hypothetical protein N6Y36_09480 [Morganella morganii]
MLTLIGLLIIISIVVLLMTGKTSPVIAMSVIPLLGALLAGYSLPEITEFFDYGIKKVASVAVMFLFAILFFSIMKDLHIFNPFIRLMIGLTREMWSLWRWLLRWWQPLCISTVPVRQRF